MLFYGCGLLFLMTKCLMSLAVLWGRKYHRMLVLPFMMGITLYICTEYAMADSTTAWMTFVVAFTLGIAVILGCLIGWAAGIHFRFMLEDERNASEEDKNSAENDE